MADVRPTIFAPASGTGRAAICVFRLSGPETSAVMDALCQSRPVARTLKLRTLREPDTNAVLDRALVVWMPGPDTYTGEDMAEFHLHGGLAIRARLAQILTSRLNCRHAEPGEFTRRAVVNGRTGLAEAEAIADLVDAETEAQRRQALKQLDGTLTRHAEAWRIEAIEILAIVEALLDFADEEDLANQEHYRTVSRRAAALKQDIQSALDDSRRGERLRHGYTVVLAGPPNVGKSTLLNSLAQREVAIVSDLPGTTRDAIEVRCDFAGLPVTLVDTAGLCESDDCVESQGVDRARRHIKAADLVLLLHSLDQPETDVTITSNRTSCLHVFTKRDLKQDRAVEYGNIEVSAHTGEGLDALVDAVCAKLTAGLIDNVVITRERHREALERAKMSLERVPAAFGEKGLELVAEDIRIETRALGELSGHVRVDDMLDRLFADFCIGK